MLERRNVSPRTKKLSIRTLKVLPAIQNVVSLGANPRTMTITLAIPQELVRTVILETTGIIMQIIEETI